jgi:hypothetical protein
MTSESVRLLHGGIETLDDDRWETAMESADPLDDDSMSAAYEHEIERGYAGENPYSLAEDQRDAGLEAHTQFLKGLADELAQGFERPLTTAEWYRLTELVDALVGSGWAPPRLVEDARARLQRFESRCRLERVLQEAVARRKHTKHGTEAFIRRRDLHGPVRMPIGPCGAPGRFRGPFVEPSDLLHEHACAGTRPVEAHAPPAADLPGTPTLWPVGGSAV